MGLPEVAPRHDPRGQLLELRPRQLADQGIASELLPPGLRLPVVHDEVGVAQLPGRPEVEHPAVDAPVEGDRRVAEGAEGDGDRSVAETCVDDLVPGQDLQRIRTALALDRDLDHRLAVREELDLVRAGVARLVDRRDSVLGWAPGLELLERDALLREIRLPLRGVRWGRGRLAEADQRALLLELLVELLERLVDLLVARGVLVRSAAAAGDRESGSDQNGRGSTVLHPPFDAILPVVDSARC